MEDTMLIVTSAWNPEETIRLSGSSPAAHGLNHLARNTD
jgi:hypothetical protein